MASRNEVLYSLNIESMLKELCPDAKPAGGNKFFARCPWGERHKNNDASPSFLVFTDTGNFKCQACGEKGSIFDLFGKVHGLDYAGAITALARSVGLETDSRRPKVTGYYEYLDSGGSRLYWKERIEPGLDDRKKMFIFFHGDDVEPGKAFYASEDDRQTGRGCDPILYCLPEVLGSETVYFTEGEKQADLLHSWGFTATTLDSGSCSQLSAVMVDQLRGRQIIMLPDNDPPGRAYADRITKALSGVAAWVKIVDLPELPEGGDFIDWAVVPGNDKARLLQLVAVTPLHCAGVTITDNKAVVPPGIQAADTVAISPESRAFPKLYFDFARHFDDSRRLFFRIGLRPLFDSLMMRIAKAAGARLPDVTQSIAHMLETDENTAREILDTALQHRLLVREDDYLTSPMITELYFNAVIICQNNARNGAKGGKAKGGKASKSRKK